LKERITFTSNGHKLVGIFEASKDGNIRLGILMCHGLTNTKEDCPLISQVKEKLRSEGYGTFRFDFYGSGESEGQFRDKTISEMVINAKDALDILSSKKTIDRGKIGLWGRSVGALIAAMLIKDERVRASVLVSAPIFPYETFYPLYAKDPARDFVTLPSSTVSGKIKGPLELSKDFFIELKKIQDKVLHVLQGASSVLMVQGDQDKKVNPEYAKHIYTILNEPKKLFMVNGANHDYVGKENQVISAVLKWYTTHLPM